MSCTLPRRCDFNQLTPAELAIAMAQHVLGTAGKSEQLTRAAELLQEARDAVADHVESQAPLRGRAAR